MCVVPDRGRPFYAPPSILYCFQEESESIFIHQNSILNQESNVGASSAASTIGAGGVGSAVGSVAGGGTGRGGGGESVCDGGKGSKLLSVSTVDNDSFVSAQDTIADLGEFDGYEDIHDDFGECSALFQPFDFHLLYHIPSEA